MQPIQSHSDSYTHLFTNPQSNSYTYTSSYEVVEQRQCLLHIAAHLFTQESITGIYGYSYEWRYEQNRRRATYPITISLTLPEAPLLSGASIGPSVS